MSAQSSFWSRTYSVVGGRVTLRMYLGEVKVSEFTGLFEEAVGEFGKVGVPHDSVVLSSNRAGMHFSNFLKMELAAAANLSKRLEDLRWKAASD